MLRSHLQDLEVGNVQSKNQCRTTVLQSLGVRSNILGATINLYPEFKPGISKLPYFGHLDSRVDSETSCRKILWLVGRRSYRSAMPCAFVIQQMLLVSSSEHNPPDSPTPPRCCPSPTRTTHPRTIGSPILAFIWHWASSRHTFRISLFLTRQTCWMSAALCETSSNEFPVSCSSSFWFFDISTSTPGRIVTFRTIFSPIKLLCS